MTRDEKLIYEGYQDIFKKAALPLTAAAIGLGGSQALFPKTSTEDIIKDKQTVARLYMKACDQKNIQYINPFTNGQRSNLYKFILLDKDNDSKIFSSITHKTSPVYDYSLGKDPENIISSHICLPIWYKLEQSAIDITISQINLV